MLKVMGATTVSTVLHVMKASEMVYPVVALRWRAQTSQHLVELVRVCSEHVSSRALGERNAKKKHVQTGKHVGIGGCGKHICSIASNKHINSGHTQTVVHVVNALAKGGNYDAPTLTP